MAIGHVTRARKWGNPLGIVLPKDKSSKMSLEGKNEKPKSAKYFIDSYAAIEMGRENVRFQRYRGMGVVLAKLDFFEIFHAGARDFGAPRAWEWLRKFEPFLQDVPLHVLAKAALVRLSYTQHESSMTDCVGYCCALGVGNPIPHRR